MARKSKVGPVREYLINEQGKIMVGIADAVRLEYFIQAEQLKEFRKILSVAIELCGEEKPKESKNE